MVRTPERWKEAHMWGAWKRRPYTLLWRPFLYTRVWLDITVVPWVEERRAQAYRDLHDALRGNK